MLGGMANPFDSIETSLNAVAVGALGNATMTWGSASVAVVFDAAYYDAAGMANSRPQARCLESAVAGRHLDALFAASRFDDEAAGLDSAVKRLEFRIEFFTPANAPDTLT